MIIIQESRCATVNFFCCAFISPAPLHLWAHNIFSHEFITLFCCLLPMLAQNYAEKMFMGRFDVCWRSTMKRFSTMDCVEWTWMVRKGRNALYGCFYCSSSLTLFHPGLLFYPFLVRCRKCSHTKCHRKDFNFIKTSAKKEKKFSQLKR